jgi:hypothetical protein
MLSPGRARVVLLCLLAVGLVRRADAWRLDIDGPGQYDDDLARQVAIDGAGRVVAVGQVGGGNGTQPVASVVKLDGATGAQLWRTDSAGTGTTAGYGQTWYPVVTDAANNVIVGGFLVNIVTRGDFAVMKLAAAGGGELWRQEINGVGNFDDVVQGIALDAAGDVIAAGGLNDGAGAFPYDINDVFTVIKFAGSDGTELWRRQFGPGAPFNDARGVVVDGAGDVVAVGQAASVAGDNQLTVVKLDGDDGSVLWSYGIDDAGGNTVALDSAGDVYVAGFSNYSMGETDFLVLRLAKATGAVVWRRDIAGSAVAFDLGSQIAVDGADDVIVVGSVDNVGAEDDWRVLKLDGATGADIWARAVAGGRSGVLRSLALDSAGNVFAGGDFSRPAERNLAVVKLSGVDGAELWQQELDGRSTYSEETELGAGVAVDSNDDVVAVGRLNNEGSPASSGDFSVLKLGGLDGAVGPVAGRRLSVSDRAGNPAARRILAVAVDVPIKVPAAGTAGDPTTNGATVTLQNPTTLESATISLPAGGSWRALGTPPGRRGYKYLDSSGSNGPCKLVLAQPGLLRVSCAGNLGPIPFSLDEPTQGALVLSVRLGAAEPQCVRFGGTVRNDAGTANPGPSGRFVATKATGFSGDCP